MDEHHSWYNGSVWHIDWPCEDMSVSDLYFMVQRFCFISWRLFDGEMFSWDNGSVWLKDQPCKIYVGQWPIFHGPLILPYIIVHTCQIPRRGGKSHGISTDLMVLWWECRSHGFWKNLFFFNFQHIWFILGLCGRKQANFMGVYDLNCLTCLKINTFSSAILFIEIFSNWNSRLYANTY